jgi:hypothetical protein
MQDRQLFEYAVIRVVPRVEREEFINVGIILYCRGKRYLKTRSLLDAQRVQCLDPLADTEQLCAYLEAFERIAAGHSAGGPMAGLDGASRFRWLTATRSTLLQTSKVHPGLCKDPDAMLDHLFESLVAR